MDNEQLKTKKEHQKIKNIIVEIFLISQKIDNIEENSPRQRTKRNQEKKGKQIRGLIQHPTIGVAERNNRKKRGENIMKETLQDNFPEQKDMSFQKGFSDSSRQQMMKNLHQGE